MGLTNSIQPIVNAIIIALLAKTSSDAVAAFGIVTRIEAFVFIILMGLSVGMGPIIGQNFGAKKFDRVKNTIKMAMRFNIIWSFMIALLLGVFAKPITELFTNDSNIVQYAVLFFWIVPITYAFSNLLNGWASVFNALGQPKRSALIIFIKMIFIMIPALIIGHYFGKIPGIFIAIAVTNLTVGIFFHLQSWKICHQKCTI